MKSYPVPLRRRPRPKSAKQLVERAKEFVWDAAGRITFWRLVKGFVLIFLFLPLVVYVVREVNRDVLIIDPFGVPKSLSEAGLSPEVMANRVGERLRVMEASTKTRMKKDVLGSQGEEASIPEVEIPGTKLGLKTIVDVARSLFHRDPKHIGGDIVVPAADAEPSTSDPSTVKRPAMITVYFKQGRNGSQALSGVAERDDGNMLVQRAAELALEQVNPYVLASYWEDHREFDKSIRVVQAITEDSSQDLQHREGAFILWGIVLYDEEKHEQAIAQYRRAIELDPMDSFPHYNWGVVLVAEKRYEEAIAKFREAIELNPQYEEAFYDWGLALSEERKYDEAIAEYQRASELNPKDADAYVGWGVALYQERKYDEAVAKYERAIELDPKTVGTWINWGNALYVERKYEEAMVKYQRATELDPKSTFAYSDWGNALCEERKYEEAMAKDQKAIELDAKNAFAYGGWGEALYGEGKYEEAMAKDQKAIELDPKNAFAYRGWGQALKMLGKNSEAEEKFAKEKELEQSN